MDNQKTFFNYGKKCLFTISIVYVFYVLYQYEDSKKYLDIVEYENIDLYEKFKKFKGLLHKSIAFHSQNRQY